VKLARTLVCFHCGLLDTTPDTCRRCESKHVERRLPIPLPTEPGWWLPLVVWVSVGLLLLLGSALRTLTAVSLREYEQLGLALVMGIFGAAAVGYGMRFGFERTFRFDSKTNTQTKLYVYELGGRLLRVHVHHRRRLALRAPLSVLAQEPPRFIPVSRVQSLIWRLNKPDVLNAWSRYLGPWKSKSLNATRFNLFVGLVRLVGLGNAEVWRHTVSELKWYSHLGKPNARTLQSSLCVVKKAFPPEAGFEQVWWNSLPGKHDSGVMLRDASELLAEHFDSVKGIATMNQREVAQLGEQLAASYCEDEDHMLRDIEHELNVCTWLDAAR